MSDDLQPEMVTALLGIQPTHAQIRGALPSPSSKHPFRSGGWFLESADHIQSRDSRRHLDWLLNQLHGKAPAIAKLQARGCLVDLCIYWVSVGQGGPTLSSSQMAQLGELGIELWFDIYFDRKDSAG
jgi:hypothetical protein